MIRLFFFRVESYYIILSLVSCLSFLFPQFSFYDDENLTGRPSTIHFIRKLSRSRRDGWGGGDKRATVAFFHTHKYAPCDISDGLIPIKEKQGEEDAQQQPRARPDPKRIKIIKNYSKKQNSIALPFPSYIVCISPLEIITRFLLDLYTVLRS